MKILKGAVSPETAVVIDDYPYGFRLRTKIRYWIETTKNGDRFCSQTLNPKVAGEKWNAPKKSTYSACLVMFEEDGTGYIKTFGISLGWSDEDKIKAFMEKAGADYPFSVDQKKKIALALGIARTQNTTAILYRIGWRVAGISERKGAEMITCSECDYAVKGPVVEGGKPLIHCGLGAFDTEKCPNIIEQKAKDKADTYQQKVNTWNALTIDERRKVEHSGICFFCGGRIVTRTMGEDSWETSCQSCDFLYDED